MFKLSTLAANFGHSPVFEPPSTFLLAALLFKKTMKCVENFGICNILALHVLGQAVTIVKLVSVVKIAGCLVHYYRSLKLALRSFHPWVASQYFFNLNLESLG